MLLKSFARSALALGLTSLALAAQAVTIHVSAVSQPLYLNDTTTTTVTLDNTAGPAMGAAGEFAVALPAEMHFTAVPGNCSPGTAPIRTMACSFGPLAAGASSPQVLSIQADVLYPTADHQNIPRATPTCSSTQTSRMTGPERPATATTPARSTSILDRRRPRLRPSRPWKPGAWVC
ncbi:hypothetical protein ACFSTJ_07240 [Ottowia pentelensis]|uniref:hypothetical protein n=1 Tax=Ottowia pentelensis TaxID=511108 RepID=UPI00362F9F8C